MRGIRSTEDLSGMVFGRLTVLELAEPAPNRETRWRCRCECGNIVDARRSRLLIGKKKSCGCQRNHFTITKPSKRLIDLTGKRFGRLTVIDRAENNARREVMWNCICDCGNKTVVKSYWLRKGMTKSCGCLRKAGIKENIFNDLPQNDFSDRTQSDN